jgi:hypothetical protein
VCWASRRRGRGAEAAGDAFGCVDHDFAAFLGRVILKTLPVVMVSSTPAAWMASTSQRGIGLFSFSSVLIVTFMASVPVLR